MDVGTFCIQALESYRKNEHENYDQLQQWESDFQVETIMVKDENL